MRGSLACACMEAMAVAGMAACLAAGAALAGPNAAATLYVDADWRTPAIEYSAPVAGPRFQVAVRIAGAQYLDSYAFELGYDTALVDFVGAAAGSDGDGAPNILETRGGTAVAFLGRLSARDTTLISVGNALAGSDSARSPSGDGLLALLEFRVKALGMARFHPGTAELLDWRQELDTAASFQGASVDIRATSALRRTLVRASEGGGAWIDPLGRRLAAAPMRGWRAPSAAAARGVR